MIPMLASSVAEKHYSAFACNTAKRTPPMSGEERPAATVSHWYGLCVFPARTQQGRALGDGHSKGSLGANGSDTRIAKDWRGVLNQDTL
jgi:hypothetical protein